MWKYDTSLDAIFNNAKSIQGLIPTLHCVDSSLIVKKAIFCICRHRMDVGADPVKYRAIGLCFVFLWLYFLLFRFIRILDTFVPFFYNCRWYKQNIVNTNDAVLVCFTVTFNIDLSDVNKKILLKNGPVFTSVICLSIVTFTWGPFHRKYLCYQSAKLVWKSYFSIY